MKSTHRVRRIHATLAGVVGAAASAALAPAASGAVTVVPAGTATHPPIVRDSGVLACTSLSRVPQVATTRYPRIRADFAHSRWPDLRLAGTAYVDLVTRIRVRHAYGGETVWFYERLSAACTEHGHPLNGNA